MDIRQDDKYLFIPYEEELWKLNAACANTDPESFFTESSGNYDFSYIKKICDSCTVIEDCLAYAIKYQMDGWWANTTVAERERMSEQKITSPQR